MRQGCKQRWGWSGPSVRPPARAHPHVAAHQEGAQDRDSMAGREPQSRASSGRAIQPQARPGPRRHRLSLPPRRCCLFAYLRQARHQGGSAWPWLIDVTASRSPRSVAAIRTPAQHPRGPAFLQSHAPFVVLRPGCGDVSWPWWRSVLVAHDPCTACPRPSGSCAVLDLNAATTLLRGLADVTVCWESWRVQTRMTSRRLSCAGGCAGF